MQTDASVVQTTPLSLVATTWRYWRNDSRQRSFLLFCIRYF